MLTTRAAYASGPPPGHEIVARTPSYVLWERREPVGNREPGERDASPGHEAGCPSRSPDTVAAFTATPVVAGDWSSATLESGNPTTIDMQLPRGRWRLSLQYDATRPLTLSGGGFEQRLPANLDYRGSVPFHDAGVIESQGGAIEVEASVEHPPLVGRLLGAEAVAHLGALAATRVGDPRLLRSQQGCAEYVDWYARG